MDLESFLIGILTGIIVSIITGKVFIKLAIDIFEKIKTRKASEETWRPDNNVISIRRNKGSTGV